MRGRTDAFTERHDVSVRTREVKYIECDGCGYTLPDRHTVLVLPYSVTEKERGKLTFHFHEASAEHDCLRYWMTGTGIMERSLKSIDLISERGREVILAAVGAFRKKAA